MERLTWVRDLDGMTDVGLRDGVTVGDAICRLAALERVLGDGYDLDHLRDLVQAEQDGRLVVLPCKVGDTAWTYANYPAKYVYPFQICAIQLMEKTMSTTCVGTIKWRDIGKTVFLTREEAEAALEGGVK